jgi:hypothetical protein
MPAFSLVSWLKLKQQLDGAARKRRRDRHVFKPHLTLLEDRVAPAAFTVNTFSDTNATDFVTGTDSTGHVSLRSAMEAANHLGLSNTISLPAGTYDLRLGELEIKNNLTLSGMGASTTTINAQFESRIFQVLSGFTVAISNVTMENGLVQGATGRLARGGGIFDSGALTLTNDTLFENLAIGGAGAAGTLGANGSSGTSTTPPTNGGAGGNGGRGGDANGGAIYLDSSARAALSVVNCAITNNEAFQGQGGSGGQGGTGGSANADFPEGGNGGIGGSGGQGGNAFGGAIYNAGGALVIQGSLVAGNFAGVSGFFFGTIVGGGSGGVGGFGGDGGLDGQGGSGGTGGTGGFAGDDSGGAIYNSSSGRVAITTSSFSQNSAIGETGGQAGAGGTGGQASIFGVFGAGGTGGSAGDASGGAIDNQGAMTIDSSSFFNNQAIGEQGGPGGAGGTGGNGGGGGTGFAGAIESFPGSLTLTHSTVSLNSAGPGAGGAAGAGGNGNPGASGNAADGGIQSVSAKSQLFDTIVAGDTAPMNPDVNGQFSSLGHNFIGDGTGSSGFTAPGDLVGTTANPINPMLNAPGNHGGPTPTMVPMVGSPVIDAGDNTNAPPTDQRGLPRIVDSDSNIDNDGPVIDIGAVEFQPTDAGPLTYDAPEGQGPNNIALLQDGSTIEVLNNSTIVAEAPRAVTTSIDIVGAQNEPNTLTLDYGPINNPNNLSTAPTNIPISFDGGSQGGTLNLKGGNFTWEELFPNDPHSGTLYLDGSPIAYTNLAPTLIDTATATTFTIFDPVANEDVVVQNDPNSPENGVPTSQIFFDGSEIVDLANKKNVVFIDSSKLGQDLIAVLNPLVNNGTFTYEQVPSITNGPATSTATVGTAYSFAYTFQGTPAPTFKLLPGSQLPPGLTLSASGVISGTPTAPGTFTGTVDAANGVAIDATQNYSITVGTAQPFLAATAGPSVVLGTGARLTASANLTGGFGPTGTITFSLHSPGGAIVDTETDSVNGAGKYQTPHGYLPIVRGSYQWVVSYSGDADNNGASTSKNEVAVGAGITVVGGTFNVAPSLYLVGGNTNDGISVAPIGASLTGSTGIKVNALLNNVMFQNVTYTRTFRVIFVVGFGGNDRIQFASTLTIPTSISEGDGNNNVQLGNGACGVLLGKGNNVVTAGTGSVNIQAGAGTNRITAGKSGSTGAIHVQLGNGAGDQVTLLGNGNDSVLVGDGNNDSVSITGDGNDLIQVGNGTNDSVTLVGNGNETVKTGTGTGTLHISGTGKRTLQLGPGWTQI